MGTRTGQPRGRPRGSKNKRTREREAALAKAAEALSAAIEGAFEGDAHAFLMAIYKDPSKDVQLRLDAAKAAIRYEKPALAQTELGGKDAGAIVIHFDAVDAKA
jgi:hypothetical protein